MSKFTSLIENNEIEDIDAPHQIIKSTLDPDQLKCINYDSKIHSDEKDLIIYEEVYHGEATRYCFSIKRDIEDLLSYNRNPLSGRLFSLDFINMIRERYGKASTGKLVELDDITKENCIECKTINECEIKINELKELSPEAIKYLDFYVSGTYMNDVKHFTIPNSIRTELSGIKLCEDYSKKLYRGVNFSLVNIPYLREYMNIKEIHKHQYIKPISTSISQEVAKGFSKYSGIVIQFTKIKSSDILIDLSILPDKIRNQMESRHIIKKEKEVILLPGLYEQRIISNDISREKANFLFKLYEIVGNDIIKKNKKYYFKGYQIENTIIDVIFSGYDDNKIIFRDYTNGIQLLKVNKENKTTILFAGNIDSIIDYVRTNLDGIFTNSKKRITKKYMFY